MSSLPTTRSLAPATPEDTTPEDATPEDATDEKSRPEATPASNEARPHARRIHELALESFRIGNRGRLSLCEALRALFETRLFLELGYPTVSAYADAFFQLRRAEAYEYVRVATALLELTRLRDAFARGQIGWSVLKAVTRVASVAKQREWLDFARRNGGERTVAEARDALRRGRDAPRKGSFGLPNLDQKLVLRFSRSDMEKVRNWIDGACAEVSEKTGAEGITLEQAILFLMERDQASLAPTPANGAAKAAPRAQIVYQRCPDCRRSRMGTREGFVEVASEEVERYEGTSTTVVIDGPTPPKLRRKILGREGGRCGNPRCPNLADDCHHIEMLSLGGKTCLENEVGVCRTCHALIHAGLLRVRGTADGERDWCPILSPDSPETRVIADTGAADRLPVLNVQVKRTTGSSGNAASSASADWAGDASLSASADGDATAGLDVEALAQGLMRLGFAAAQAKRAIHTAIEALPPVDRTEAGVLRRALGGV